MNNMKISIAKLAEICNTSQGTVDRALNNRNGININTKQKIVSTAIKYGYRPKNKIKTKLIGLIVFNLNNEFFSSLVTLFERVCKENGCSTVVMFTDYSEEQEIECILNMYNMGVEGILMCPVNSSDEFRRFVNGINIPIVCVGNRSYGIPYVGIDDFSAMRDLIKDMLKEKFDNIIYFSPALKYGDAYAQQKRAEGFLKAIGNKYNYSLITNIDDINECYDGKTIIICSTDYYALKVYFKTKNAIITGFDNIDALDKYKFKITTVSYSIDEISRNAFAAFSHNKDVFINYKIIKR